MSIDTHIPPPIRSFAETHAKAEAPRPTPPFRPQENPDRLRQTTVSAGFPAAESIRIAPPPKRTPRPRPTPLQQASQPTYPAKKVWRSAIFRMSNPISIPSRYQKPRPKVMDAPFRRRV